MRKSNSIIGGSAPSIYLGRILRDKAIASVQEQDSILASHGITAALIRTDDFAAFYATRREALLQMIEIAKGKIAYLGETASAGAVSDEIESDDEGEDDIVEDAAALAA